MADYAVQSELININDTLKELVKAIKDLKVQNITNNNAYSNPVPNQYQVQKLINDHVIYGSNVKTNSDGYVDKNIILG